MKRLCIGLVLLLAGCTTMPGVQATPEELKACEESGCTVWTEGELLELIRQIYKKGYDAGVKSI